MLLTIYSSCRMDIHEDAKSNTITATFELPGLKKEDVSIDIHNNLLTISGESKISSEHEEGGYAVRERRFGKFSRSIPLPEGVKVSRSHLEYHKEPGTQFVVSQSEQIGASLDNGVLTVTFPKSTPEQAPKKIAIS